MRTTRAARSQDDLNGNLPGPVAGIDIGGTKIATLIVDAAGAVLGRATHASSVGDQGGAVASIAQLSLAVGAVHVATWSQVSRPAPVVRLMFPGSPAITGLVSSTTVTVKLAVSTFPAASLAV